MRWGSPSNERNNVNHIIQGLECGIKKDFKMKEKEKEKL